MKTAAVGNTVPSQEVTRLTLGRTFSAGKVVLSSVREHKLLQAAFLYNNMWYLATDGRGMLGQSYHVPVGQLPSPILSLLEGQFVLPGQLNGAMSSLLLSPQCSPNTHSATPPKDKFEQAVCEARNEANTKIGRAHV